MLGNHPLQIGMGGGIAGRTQDQSEPVRIGGKIEHFIAAEIDPPLSGHDLDRETMAPVFTKLLEIFFGMGGGKARGGYGHGRHLLFVNA